MTTFHPSAPSYEGRIPASFAKQGLLQTLSASLVNVAPGRVEIMLTPDSAVSQQHGFVHAGALVTEFKSTCSRPRRGSASLREGVPSSLAGH